METTVRISHRLLPSRPGRTPSHPAGLANPRRPAEHQEASEGLARRPETLPMQVRVQTPADVGPGLGPLTAAVLGRKDRTGDAEVDGRHQGWTVAADYGRELSNW